MKADFYPRGREIHVNYKPDCVCMLEWVKKVAQKLLQFLCKQLVWVKICDCAVCPHGFQDMCGKSMNWVNIIVSPRHNTQ